MKLELTLGIDGGGTQTRAVLVDGSGAIVGRARAGSGNFQAVGLQGVEALVDELMTRLGVEAAKGSGPPLVSACLALAGAGRTSEQEEVANRLLDNQLANHIYVVSDARAALEGAHAGAEGIVVIAGTGSMVLGKNAAGAEGRAGGWGPTLGDEGSGYWLVLQAIRSVLRQLDGWGPPTVLKGELGPALELEDWHQVVAGVYGGRLDRRRIAAAAPCVFASARQGDEEALRIVRAGARSLGCQAGAVALHLGMTDVVDVAGAGGLFEQADLFWGALEEGMLTSVGQVCRRAPILSPVMGALILAHRGAGREWSPDWIASLAEADAEEA